MHKWIATVVVIGWINLVNAQEVQLPAEAQHFVPAGHLPLAFEAGDINSDGRPDALLVTKQAAEDTAADDLKRALIVLLRQPGGGLTQVLRNDDAILCRNCGGIFGDPFESISIDKNGFSIQFYGGSNWRWAIGYSFEYKAALQNWCLQQESHMIYHTSNPDKTTAYSIPAEELGTILLDRFNAAPPSTASNWKVVASKAYFYSNPLLGSKARKAYLVKGDRVESYRELVHFIRVVYTNKKEETTEGFLLKKDVLKEN